MSQVAAIDPNRHGLSVNCYPWLLYPWTLTKYRLQIADPQGKLERFLGVLAQLVERLNGIEEVRGSNPLGSTLKNGADI